MSVFGESGPKNVQVLSHPTRRQSKSGQPGPAVGDGGRRMSLDSEMAAAEAGDHFPAPSQLPLGQTWPAVQRPLGSSSSSSTRKGIDRWSSSNLYSSSKQSTSQRFAQPLASEGQGSVFPVGLPLSKRRALEVELIKRFDRLNINTHIGEFWFLIDAIWMSQWIDFVMGKTGPPGPISNNNLFVQYAGNKPESLLARHAASARSGVMTSRPDLRLKDGLQKVRDYRAVHPLVWYIYREIYSADDAPELCRWKANIYLAEVLATRKVKFSEEMHTKAVYELRRFCAKVKNEMHA